MRQSIPSGQSASIAALLAFAAATIPWASLAGALDAERGRVPSAREYWEGRAEWPVSRPVWATACGSSVTVGDPCESWSGRHATAGDHDLPGDVATSPDGERLYLASATFPPDGSTPTGRVVAYATRTGNPAWVTETPGRLPFSLAPSSDGRLLHVSESGTGLVALDARSGARVWASALDSPEGWSGFPGLVARSPTGDLVFAAGARIDAGIDFATFGLRASTGEVLWGRSYDGPIGGYEFLTGLAVSPDGGRVYVAGGSDGPESGFDFAVVAYDARTGAEAWVARYDAPARWEDFPLAVGVSPDGSRVYVTGFSFGDWFDYATWAIDARTGGTAWISRFQGPTGGNDFAVDLAVDPAGERVYVTGFSTVSVHGPQPSTYVTLAHDARTGDLIWLSAYGAGRDRNFPSSLAASPDGASLYVTGASHDPGTNYHVATVALDAALGVERWSVRYGEPSSQAVPGALVASPGGDRLYVAVAETQARPDALWDVFGPGPIDYDLVTLAYETSRGLRLPLG